MVRGQVTDEHWAIACPLLPSERGRGCRPAHDNRRFFDGMMCTSRTGIRWRDLLAEFGNWNSISAGFGAGASRGCSTPFWRRWSSLGSPTTSIRSSADIFSVPVHILPKTVTSIQYVHVFGQYGTLSYLRVFELRDHPMLKVGGEIRLQVNVEKALLFDPGGGFRIRRLNG